MILSTTPGVVAEHEALAPVLPEPLSPLNASPALADNLVVCIVMELCERGDLAEYMLAQRKKRQVNPRGPLGTRAIRRPT